MENKNRDSLMRTHVEQAKAELCLALYLSDCGSNLGLRQMWGNKASWLSSLIYLAERQLAEEEQNA